MGIVNISLLIRWCLGWLLSLRMPALPASAPRGNPAVAVLIPARNEASTLPHLLNALQHQSVQPSELLVIDDHSSDQTAQIALQTCPQLGVRLVRPPPLPEGWCGKTWALHCGVAACSADLLMFLDADTEPAPDFLAALLACHQQLGGLVSVQPYHRTERGYEQLSLLFNLVGLMAVPLGPHGGVAFGPAMVTSRADYERIGGHQAVAGKVVEDWFLAHLYERAGLPVSAFIGHGLLAYRMYPGGLGDMVMGFAKNFATAAGEVRWLRMLGVLLWLSGLFWAAWCLPASLLGWPMVGDRSLAANLLLYGAFALQLLLLSRRVGSFGWINLIFPVPVVFFLGVFGLAITNLERGYVQWKGRTVPTRP
jgi:glycosyltransferase involved in cell wall biosynthesis